MNRWITKKDIETILNKYEDSYNIEIDELDVPTFQQAFIHKSFTEESILMNKPVMENCERLEYLGDHILKAIMGYYLFERFHDQDQGFLTKLKTRIERTSTLAQFAKDLGFKEFLILSQQVEAQSLVGQNRGRNTISYYEDAFEAFVGALFLVFATGNEGRVANSGLAYALCERFIRNIIDEHIDFSELIYRNDNYKDILQRYFQKCKWNPPTYISIYEKGQAHRKIFYRAVFINQSQWNELEASVREQLLQYKQTILEQYKLDEPNVFIKLNEMENNKLYLISIEIGDKVIHAEQKCSRQAIINLDIGFDF